MLKATGLYDWLVASPWLLLAAFAVVSLAVAVIMKSSRDFLVRKLSALCRWLKRARSLKSLAAEMREKARVRRIRRKGRLEASERTTRAMEILPYLNGPNAEKTLRRHTLRVSDDFLDSLRIGSSSSVRMFSGDEQRYHRLKDAESRANPVVLDGCALWLLDDYSVVVAKPDGVLEIGTQEQAETARKSFLRSMEEFRM